MSLLLTNATISTTGLTVATGQTVAKLVQVRAAIGPPAQKDLLIAGGIVRYVVLLDPARDIQPGDQLTITTWGQHTVPTRPLHVFAADPEGGLGLEVIRCVVGERVQR